MKQLYTFCAVLFASLLTLPAMAQLTIVPNATAAMLAGSLAGTGVTIINPVLTCEGNANGIFSGTSTIGFANGIVLTTGQALSNTDTTGVDGPGSYFANTPNGTPGDAQLTTLVGQPTYDACILEFDFVPAADTLRFNYVFGSEEYTDYTCSPFNDVFGFFISGPGYASSVNIPLVPGTSIPVCINSVNCGPTGGYPDSNCTILGTGAPFCAYYVNNLAGTTITYDGLTTVLQAVAAVTPTDTFHLKIGVADAADDAFDSGVFLESGSFTSAYRSGTSGIGIPASLPRYMVFPNPTDDLLNITSTAGSAYALTDMLGATWQKGALNNGMNSISLKPLAAGMYCLLITDDKGQTTVKSIIKQ